MKAVTYAAAWVAGVQAVLYLVVVYLAWDWGWPAYLSGFDVGGRMFSLMAWLMASGFLSIPAIWILGEFEE